MPNISLEVIDQTSAIERVPMKPGLIGALGLFADEVVATDAVSFDVRDNQLGLLDDHLRNVDQKNGNEDEPFAVHTLAIPHYPIAKTIGREKLAGLRAFGQEGELLIAQAVAGELERQAERHDIQEEYLKAAMVLQGVVVTNNYGTINMATEFGVTRPTVNIGTADSVAAKLREATNTSKGALRTGGRVAGYVLFAGVELFERILTSSDVAQAYAHTGSGSNPLLNELGSVASGYTSFRFGNVDVVLYDDTFTNKAGQAVSVLDSNKGVLVPRTRIGRTFYGPSSTLSGLGKFGSKRFAQSYRDPKDRYVEVESEQSTLVINEQYGATVLVTFTV